MKIIPKVKLTVNVHRRVIMKEKKIIPLEDGGTVTKISSKFKISPKVRLKYEYFHVQERTNNNSSIHVFYKERDVLDPSKFSDQEYIITIFVNDYISEYDMKKLAKAFCFHFLFGYTENSTDQEMSTITRMGVTFYNKPLENFAATITNKDGKELVIEVTNHSLSKNGGLRVFDNKLMNQNEVRIRHALYKAVTELDLLKEVK